MEKLDVMGGRIRNFRSRYWPVPTVMNAAGVTPESLKARTQRDWSASLTFLFFGVFMGFRVLPMKPGCPSQHGTGWSTTAP